MALYMVTNQHQPDDCPELSDELSSYYEVNKPTAELAVYCNCRAGEHRMFFLVDSSSVAEALETVPPGFLGTATTVTKVEKAYKFAEA